MFTLFQQLVQRSNSFVCTELNTLLVMTVSGNVLALIQHQSYLDVLFVSHTCVYPFCKELSLGSERDAFVLQTQAATEPSNRSLVSALNL